MEPAAIALLLVGLVGASTIAGLALSRRTARVRRTGGTGPGADAGRTEGASVASPASAEQCSLTPRVAARSDELPDELTADLGAQATIVQFSTEYCSRCPGTARLLASVAADHTGIVHREIDVTERRDLLTRFSVSTTPTILVLDGAGSIRSRFDGAPTRAAVLAELDALDPRDADSRLASALPDRARTARRAGPSSPPATPPQEQP